METSINTPTNTSDILNKKYSLIDALKPTVMDMSIVRERLYNMLPENYQGTSEMVNVLETLLEDTEDSPSGIAQDQLVYSFSDKFITAINSLSSSVVNTPEYALACKFVSYTSIGFSNGEAYSFVFPNESDNIAIGLDLLDEDDVKRYTEKLERSGRAFASRAMVHTIMEVTSVSLYIAHAPTVNKAVNKLVYLMDNSVSEKIQLESAVALINKLGKPDKIKEQENRTDLNSTKSILDAFKEISATMSTNATNAIKSGDTTITDVIALTKECVTGNDE